MVSAVEKNCTSFGSQAIEREVQEEGKHVLSLTSKYLFYLLNMR